MKDRLITSFARRIARPLSENQKILLETFLPTIKVKDAGDTVEKSKNFKTTSLEIGFGNGEFILNYARKNPENLCIGCEPFLNGVSAMLRTIEVEGIKNINIWADDVRLILNESNYNTFDDIFIICPDPWPKKRHLKRRLINNHFLQILEKHLKIDGTLHMITDHEGYAEWILDALKTSNFKAFNQNAELSQFLLKEQDWLFTKYQRRGLSLEHKIYYFKIS